MFLVIYLFGAVSCLECEPQLSSMIKPHRDKSNIYHRIMTIPFMYVTFILWP